MVIPLCAWILRETRTAWVRSLSPNLPPSAPSLCVIKQHGVCLSSYSHQQLSWTRDMFKAKRQRREIITAEMSSLIMYFFSGLVGVRLKLEVMGSQNTTTNPPPTTRVFTVILSWVLQSHVLPAYTSSLLERCLLPPFLVLALLWAGSRETVCT